MQKKDDVALASFEPNLKLPGAAALGVQYSCSGATCPLRGAVLASAIDDDDVYLRPRGARDRPCDLVGLIERGYHHRDSHSWHNSMPSAFPSRLEIAGFASDPGPTD
jgi:hypothetical protein